jgi:hypothetical protein
MWSPSFQRGDQELFGVKFQHLDRPENLANFVHLTDRALVASALPYLCLLKTQYQLKRLILLALADRLLADVVRPHVAVPDLRLSITQGRCRDAVGARQRLERNASAAASVPKRSKRVTVP